MALLEAQHINMFFGGLKALNDVSLQAEEGKISALIGPNGAGKTTLFNVMTGFLVPTAGKVLFRGEEVQGLPAYKYVEKGLSRTFQNIRLLQEMTVLENVQLGCHHNMKQNLFDELFISPRCRREENESRESSMEALEFVGLGDLAGEKAKNLPYGHQRKLEIARTLATGAEMLLFDEPCAGMNTAEKAQLSELILDINKKLKKTVMLIEHDMRFVMKLSDTITVLAQGEWLAAGSPEEIQANPKVIEAYLGTKRKAVGYHVGD
ncbi:ABC transporter ATP-binding protein [Lacrimispora sp. NSJ-141]|uniref:ABC transporter ATP-binding protein n=1 Tax=Lientehia hominis TaxID=2897778 RepID=A0AAP2RI26_9FIRM|nr:ABC transporter ATP-binding protein [Lientehia hominis]MCD2492572.1 ABC transporter ATP-binding protein [Lientehia hominis]